MIQTRHYLVSLLVGLVCGFVTSGCANASQVPQVNQLLGQLDSPQYRMVSDEDQANMAHIKNQISNDYADFKSIDEVHSFLEKVRLLVQKHPRNIAFAQGDLKDLHKFLSQEIVVKLIRVDNEIFNMPITDDRLQLAQRAVDDDDLIRKLFGGPLRSLVEAKRNQMTRGEDGNHKDGNFFTSFWCKISGGCQNNQ